MAITLPAILGPDIEPRRKSKMRRRKATTVQINVRLDTMVVDQLEARAKANRVSFSEEARQRLIDSLNPKLEPSLADLRASWLHWLRRLRDALETVARQKGGNIEETWPVLSSLDAEFSQLYGSTETKLSKYVGAAEIRELLRGPALPDETKSKP
jgi:hypothetical protein